MGSVLIWILGLILTASTLCFFCPSRFVSKAISPDTAHSPSVKFLRDLFFVGIKKRGGNSDLKMKAVSCVSFYFSGIQGYGKPAGIHIVASRAIGRQYYVGYELVRFPLGTPRGLADLDQNTSQGQRIWCIVQHVKPGMQVHRFPKFLRFRWFLPPLFLWKPQQDFSRVFPSNIKVTNIYPLASKKCLQISGAPNRLPGQKQDDPLQDPHCRQDSGKPRDFPLYGKILTFILAVFVISFGGWLSSGPRRILGTTLGVIGIGLLASSLTMIGFCDPLFWRAE